MGDRYDVVYTGRLRPGADPERVLDGFSRQFDIGLDTARAMLAAERELVIRSAVSVVEANKLRHALESLGMSVVLRALQDSDPETDAGLELVPKSGGENRLPRVVHGHPLNTGTLCPKCGTQQPAARECVNCGLVFEKYFHRRARDEDIDISAETVASHPPLARRVRLSTVLLALLVAAAVLAYWLT